MAKVVRPCVFPDLRPAPIGQRAHLKQYFSRREPMLLELSETFSRGRLLPAQTGEPDLEGFERLHKRLDFPQLAASGGVVAIQNSECGLLLWHRFLGKNVDKVEPPIPGKLIAKLNRFRKVISGFEKEYRDIRKALSQQIQHDDVFGLKTTSQASGGRPGVSQGRIHNFLRGMSFERFQVRGHVHFRLPFNSFESVIPDTERLRSPGGSIDDFLSVV